MKKFLSVLALLVAVMAVSFATSVAPPTPESGSVNVREGRNIVWLRDSSTLLFNAHDGEIDGVEVRNVTGQLIKFGDEGCSTCGVQPPKPCTGETRCFYSEKYQSNICFCIPKPVLSNGGGSVDYHLKMEHVFVTSHK